MRHLKVLNSDINSSMIIWPPQQPAIFKSLDWLDVQQCYLPDDRILAYYILVGSFTGKGELSKNIGWLSAKMFITVFSFHFILQKIHISFDLGNENADVYTYITNKKINIKGSLKKVCHLSNPLDFFLKASLREAVQNK